MLQRVKEKKTSFSNSSEAAFRLLPKSSSFAFFQYYLNISATLVSIVMLEKADKYTDYLWALI